MGHPPDPVVACSHSFDVRLSSHERRWDAPHAGANKALQWLHRSEQTCPLFRNMKQSAQAFCKSQKTCMCLALHCSIQVLENVNVPSPNVLEFCRGLNHLNEGHVDAVHVRSFLAVHLQHTGVSLYLAHEMNVVLHRACHAGMSLDDSKDLALMLTKYLFSSLAVSSLSKLSRSITWHPVGLGALVSRSVQYSNKANEHNDPKA